MSLYLLMDSTFLAHRAYHSTGGLQHEGEATGVAYGVLRAVEALCEQFGPDYTAHAWDYGGPGLRGQAAPGYKASRAAAAAAWDDDERQAREWFRRQVLDLRAKHLPALGYRNVFCERGYEADDIIATVVENLPPGAEAIIVSADQDLWQLISARVKCYNPITGKFMCLAKFQQAYYGLCPFQWAAVKAVAGCKTDDIEGIRGIGEKTAAAYYTGNLKPTSKKYKAIQDNIQVYNRNIDLTRLPYPGLTLPPLAADALSPAGKAAVYGALGFRDDRAPRKRAGFFESV